MQRRDFLKAFTAFTAALAAGVRMPSGREAAASLVPEPAAPPPAPVAQAMSAQEQVMAMLVDCDVVSYQALFVVEGVTRYQVTYQMDKVRGRRSVHFNEQVKSLIKGKRPVEITVHAIGRDVDITSFGKLDARMVEPVYEIEVVWA